MLFFVATYSFDSDRPVWGPFKDSTSCWEAMKKNAEEEFRIDTEENGWVTEPLRMQEDEGIIELRNAFSDHEDVTTWSMIDVPCEMSDEKMSGIMNLFKDNGIDVEKAKTMLSQMKDIFFSPEK